MLRDPLDCFGAGTPSSHLLALLAPRIHFLGLAAGPILVTQKLGELLDFHFGCKVRVVGYRVPAGVFENIVNGRRGTLNVFQDPRPLQPELIRPTHSFRAAARPLQCLDNVGLVPLN